MAAKENDTQAKDEKTDKLTVVALGASAGGLEALTEFFEQVPAESGVAFVVVTHQHPSHTSLLPELVAKHTRLDVREAKDGDELKPNHVYIAPSKGHLELFHNKLQLINPEQPESFHLPIDSFFRSLAEDQNERSICIVLSGMGTDGTLGIRAVKGVAGMVMVQLPESAKYSGMPQSAVDTGLADYILPAAELPSQLLSYVSGSFLGASGTEGKGELTHVLPKIFIQLRRRTGHDFSSYKTSTIERRIERRMNVHQIDLPRVYLEFLRQHPHEVDQLFKELLISVTSFFRDPEAFDVLRQAIAKLVASKSQADTIRVWIPGCATGEEAYSVAILINECLTELEKNQSVQVFGTDLDSEAIETAREGRYSEGIAIDVDAQRLRRFFTKEEKGYRIKKEVREMVVFAPHNIIKDPPFTKLDLLSCRNLLIYLNSDLQKRLLPVMHYALNPDGLLFLGPSESIGESHDLFGVESKKWRLYRQKEAAGVKHLEFPLTSTEHELRESARVMRPKIPAARRTTDLLNDHLVNAFVPPTVVVDAHGDVIHVQGKTGPYLELASGHMSSNLLELAREGLQLDLATALRRASTSDRPVVHKNVRVKSTGEFTQVDISVTKIHDPEPIRGMLAVTFAPAQAAPVEQTSEEDEQDAGQRSHLQQEMQHLKETLQATIEEYETTNEELKSTNEELQSTNEELQSSNEELETSKEEMQSLNEELQTLNAELLSKVDELTKTSDDMQNLLNGTEISTLFVDGDLHIKRFTQSATKLFRVRDVDVGRHLSEIVTDLDYRDLIEDVERVLKTLVFEEKEVSRQDGSSSYRLRIIPYRTSDNVIDGVVLTFFDITELREAREYAESVVSTVPEPLLVLDGQLRVTSTNPAFCDLFQMPLEGVVGNRVYELGNRQWDIPQLRELLEHVLPDNSVFRDYEVDHEFPKIGKRKMLLSGRRLQQHPDSVERVFLAFKDITDSN